MSFQVLFGFLLEDSITVWLFRSIPSFGTTSNSSRTSSCLVAPDLVTKSTLCFTFTLIYWLFWLYIFNKCPAASLLYQTDAQTESVTNALTCQDTARGSSRAAGLCQVTTLRQNKTRGQGSSPGLFKVSRAQVAENSVQK